MRNVIGLLLLSAMFWSGSAPASQRITGLVQCEECASIDQMRPRAIGQAALGSGGGRYAVFSLKHGIVQLFDARYLPERNQIFANPLPPNDHLEEAFAHMLNAYERRSGALTGQQVFRGRIDDLPGGEHDPVEISLNGEHDDAYGSFIYDVKSCFYSAACTARIHPELADLVGANSRLSQIGITFFGTGGNLAWENLPPTAEIWLCNDNRDCARVALVDGRWEYLETRAEDGQGKRYPTYRESATYRFANSGEAGIFRRGLVGGGARVLGSWNLMTVLACTTVAHRKTCEYVTIPY